MDNGWSAYGRRRDRGRDRAADARAAQRDESAGTTATSAPPAWRGSGSVAVAEPDEVDADDDDEDLEDAQVVAVTSDGSTFVPDRHAVRLVPPEEPGEEWKTRGSGAATNLRGQHAMAMSWHAGDLTGVRVVRGEADEGPWRLEALGRDGEYTWFAFETREGAEATKELFERLKIVRLGEDEDGRPMPPSAEQFAEARRLLRETEAALELHDDEEPR